MKKYSLVFILFFVVAILNAAPGRGGYMGHRIILNGEFAYSPCFNSANAFFTKYNAQYGVNFGVIVGRRSQLNVNYNMWNIGNNEFYHESFVSADKLKGHEFGLTLKKFNKGRGGIAPIGKYYEFGLSYAHNDFVASSENPDVIQNYPENVKFGSDIVLVHLAYGTQMVFWDHLIANTGVRFGTPLMEMNQTGIGHPDFISTRMRYKELFSVFFGVGILL